MLLICPSRDGHVSDGEIVLKKIEMSASLYSEDKLLLLDVWTGKGPKTRFSGQTYNTLFSRACSMNPVCFTEHFLSFLGLFFNL